MFHSPDGTQLLVQTDAVEAVRPIDAKHHDHVAKGTGSVIYLGARPNGFAIQETTDEALNLIKNCKDKGQ